MAGRRVLLGRIVGVHGVHGAVKLESFAEPRNAIFDLHPWLLERTMVIGDELNINYWIDDEKETPQGS